MSDEKIKTSAKKPQLALVPAQALVGAARVFAFGARKYSPGNFLNADLTDGAGSRYIGAALRHMSEMQLPNGLHTPGSLASLDIESGLPHIDHLICGLLMLRSIMVKCGALPVDPGEGLEPPTAVTAVKATSAELTRILNDVARSMHENDKKIVEHRVQQGNFDVIPYGGEFGGCETTMAAEDAAHPISDSVFKGRENDDWSSRDVEPFERAPVIRDSHNDYGSYNDYLDGLRNGHGSGAV